MDLLGSGPGPFKSFLSCDPHRALQKIKICYHPHFADKETETERHQASKKVTESRPAQLWVLESPSTSNHLAPTFHLVSTPDIEAPGMCPICAACLTLQEFRVWGGGVDRQMKEWLHRKGQAPCPSEAWCRGSQRRPEEAMSPGNWGRLEAQIMFQVVLKDV